MPIVWEMPDRSVRIMQLSEKFLVAHKTPTETTEAAVKRLAEIERNKSEDLRDATAYLVRTADLPANRETRKAWRMQNGVCIVDPSVVLPPKPLTLEQRIAKLEALK